MAGTIEIAGKAAKLFVLNKNGIVLKKGFNLLNARHALFSTGAAENINSKFWHIDVAQGDVEFDRLVEIDLVPDEGDEGSYQPEPLKSFTVLARNIDVGKGIKAPGVNVTLYAGPNRYNPRSSKLSALLDDDDIEQARRTKGTGITGHWARAMHGNKIFFEATETKTGIRLAGLAVHSNDFSVKAHQGDIEIGHFESSGKTASYGRDVSLGSAPGQVAYDPAQVPAQVAYDIDELKKETKPRPASKAKGGLIIKATGKTQLNVDIKSGGKVEIASREGITNRGYLSSTEVDIHGSLTNRGIILSQQGIRMHGYLLDNSGGLIYNKAGKSEIFVQRYINPYSLYTVNSNLEMPSIYSAGRAELIITGADDFITSSGYLPTGVKGFNLHTTQGRFLHDRDYKAHGPIRFYGGDDIDINALLSSEGNIYLEAPFSPKRPSIVNNNLIYSGWKLTFQGPEFVAGEGSYMESAGDIHFKGNKLTAKPDSTIKVWNR
ncbi:MAG: hypothetical protein KZQ60_18545 [Candidatus Thiodiazotropha sp. (ex Lucinoma aequizonata)]|nr:hypothetical protein [Candidatus Thiodiazotropha sp. (ex Lucinoma aequizonata)]MCU7900441.1 hypothetical protein [Candidatus Thiodiazotropha sp. (ex Lucinoma aequizonata)]